MKNNKQTRIEFQHKYIFKISNVKLEIEFSEHLDKMLDNLN
jgi:hypothetical protein